MAEPLHPLAMLNPDAMDQRELEHTAMLLGRMARYCELKAEAMANRASGNVRRALDLETTCDAIHAGLPDDWRW